MKILGKEAAKSLLNMIVADICGKRELATVDRGFALDLLVKELKKDPKILSFILSKDPAKINRSEKYKSLVKKVRAVLRKTYGVFTTSKTTKRDELLRTLKEKMSRTDSIGDSIEEHKAVLEAHLSTKERMEIYPELYWKIWELTDKPYDIIDLGSGLNPLSFPWMGLEKVNYLATEMSQSDCDFLNSYFESAKKFGMYGLAIKMNLQDIKEKPELLKSLPKSWLCLMLKLLDTIELGKGHKLSSKIIESVPARWVVVSFPTQTIGKRKMGRRENILWLEDFCEKNKYNINKFKLGEELFYVIDKVVKE
ncbi:MAG TPA: hypothetical protein ENN30_01085 [Candidatus Woesearchaeota archaeon]|nr:hypothetical protein [Candidatus Woesearchaeota archaeon]